MYCPNCGEKISKQVNFCPNCGQNIKEFLEQEEQEKRRKDEEKFENIFEKASERNYKFKHDAADISDIFEVVNSPGIENTSEHTIVFRNTSHKPSQDKEPERSLIEEEGESIPEENEVFITKGYEESIKKKKLREDIEFTNERQFTINFDTSVEEKEVSHSGHMLNWKNLMQRSWTSLQRATKQTIDRTYQALDVVTSMMCGNKTMEFIGLLIIAVLSLFPIFMFMKQFTAGVPTMRLVMLYVAMLILFALEVFWVLAVNSTGYRALQYFNGVVFETSERRARSIILSVIISFLFFGVYFLVKGPVGISSSVITANFFGSHAAPYVIILLINIFLLICSVKSDDRKILLKRAATIAVSVVVSSTIIYLIAATVIRTILYHLANVIF